METAFLILSISTLILVAGIFTALVIFLKRRNSLYIEESAELDGEFEMLKELYEHEESGEYDFIPQKRNLTEDEKANKLIDEFKQNKLI